MGKQITTADVASQITLFVQISQNFYGSVYARGGQERSLHEIDFDIT